MRTAKQKTCEQAGLTVRAKPPKDIEPATLEGVARLIAQGGQVRPENLRNRLMTCQLIGYAADRAKIVAVAALKTPHDTADDNPFVKARSAHKYQAFRLEFGFLMVSPVYRRRHLASRLTELLCTKMACSNIYATVRENNHYAQSILAKYGFVQSGRPFADRAGTGNLLLFVRVPNEAVTFGEDAIDRADDG